jgi:DNA-binding transcriptional ArsR family regulator
MEFEQYVAILKSLSDDSRFKIINLLLNQDLCVGGLAKRLDISKAAVSQHLQVLRKIGMVTGEKRGYFTHYVVNRDLLKQVGEKTIELAEQTPSSNMCHRDDAGICQCTDINIGDKV